MNRTIFTMSVLLLLVGCAGSPARLAMMSPDELKAESSLNLCNAYDNNGSEKIIAELKRRGEISDEEWGLIEQKKIRIGMSELALVCSWGGPGLYGSVNESVSRWGVHKQWVYRACSSCGAQYVYTENGKVTSWKN